MWVALRRALIVGCLMAAPLAGQDSLPPLHAVVPVDRREIRVSWGFVRFVVTADSTRGVVVYMKPRPESYQEPQRSDLEYAAFDPTFVRQWTLLVARGIGQAWPDPKPDKPVRLATPLPATAGQGYFMIAKDPRTAPQNRFLMVYRDSAGHDRWASYANEGKVRELIQALDELADISRFDSVEAMRADSVQGLPGSRGVQKAPTLVSMPVAHLPSAVQQVLGQVWVRYVVTPGGRVDSESIHILLTDGPLLTEEVRKVLATAAYEPGRLGGEAVRVLLSQVFIFNTR
jgi:hypothetical protein